MKTVTFLIVCWIPILFAQRQEWVYLHNGSANTNDYCRSVFYGQDGNIYATGGDSSTVTSVDIWARCFFPDGSEKWSYHYNNTAYNNKDWSRSIVRDSIGNIYICGTTVTSTGRDIIVIKLDSLLNEQWKYFYNGSGNQNDEPNGMIVDNTGIYIVGYTHSATGQTDFLAIKLNSGGTEQWIYKYNGPGNYYDNARGIAKDESGIYICGGSFQNTSNVDFALVKLDNLGTEQWVYRYDGPVDGHDECRNIVVGNDGYIYTCGHSDWGSTVWDAVIFKFDANGNEEWMYRYDGPASGHDDLWGICGDTDCNVYVCGESAGNSTGQDYTVLSVDSAGNGRWLQRYNGTMDNTDMANNIIIDKDEEIYVAGCLRNIGSDYDVFVTSFTQEGFERWTYVFQGTAHLRDDAGYLSCDNDYHLCIGGYAYSLSTNIDGLVMKLRANNDFIKPAAPMLISPFNGSEHDELVTTFIWNSVVDSGWGTREYELQYSIDSLLTNPTTDIIPDTSFETTLTDTNYFWRVRAIDYASNVGYWSTIWCFTIDTTEFLIGTVDIEPDIVNLNSAGRRLLCYIELPDGYNVEDINLTTVAITALDDSLIDPAVYRSGPTEIGDYDDDDIPDLKVEFDKRALAEKLQAILSHSSDVQLTVTGELLTGSAFKGIDSVYVIIPQGGNRDTWIDKSKSEGFSANIVSNPVKSIAVLHCTIEEDEQVDVKVYEVNGRLVAVLVDKYLEANDYQITWNGEDSRGNRVENGVYFCRVTAGSNATTKKILVVR